MNKSRNILIFECLCVLFTGIGKVVFINILDFRLPFIITSCLLWFAYALVKWNNRKKLKADIAKSSEKGFTYTMKELLPYAFVLFLVFVSFGLLTKRSVVDHTIIYILLLYPVWGILQQYLVLGIFGKNLKILLGSLYSDWVVVLITAVLFSIVHYPSLILIGATFFLAIVYVSLFLRGRSMLAMGVYHGWLAAFFFYFVLERNPWLEAFG